MEKNVLYRCMDSFVKIEDITSALIAGGVKQGDTIFIHADVSTIGRLAQANRSLFLGGILTAFKEAVGLQGTIIMPTFTYSFCRGEIYDIKNSPSTVGCLTEYFRNLSEVVRTKDPIFSTAIWGKNAKEYVNVSKNCFGTDSIFDYMHRDNAKIVMFGTPKFPLTHFHYVEQKLNMPYRFIKKFTGIIKNNDEEYSDEVFYFVRKLDEISTSNPRKLQNYLRSQDVVSTIPIGFHYIEILQENEIFDSIYNMLIKDPYIILE
ncbi:MAG: AAC(3) family N-acetyltransferase [Ruminiclostridium sp.]